jgi:hypothetical protein
VLNDDSNVGSMISRGSSQLVDYMKVEWRIARRVGKRSCQL